MRTAVTTVILAALRVTREHVIYLPLTTRMVSVGAKQGFECLVGTLSSRMATGLFHILASQKLKGDAKYELCQDVGCFHGAGVRVANVTEAILPDWAYPSCGSKILIPDSLSLFCPVP